MKEEEKNERWIDMENKKRLIEFEGRVVKWIGMEQEIFIDVGI